MFSPFQPGKRRFWDRITLTQLHRLKLWREARHASHPVERWMWETVLTLWMMGWIGWLPAFASEASWAYPLCLLGMLSPGIYVYWRARAHQAGQLQCEWLHLLDQPER